MKTKILLAAAALISAATLSAHAGGHFGFSFGFPLPPPPPFMIAAHFAPPCPPVVVAPPVYAAPVYAVPPVCAPSVVVDQPPCPGPGYFWAPGHWVSAYGGRVWVPSAWRYNGVGSYGGGHVGYGGYGYGGYGHGGWNGGHDHGDWNHGNDHGWHH